ncbi:MAG: site-specific DNA-methyltransferase [Phycisphaerae bacterium]
MEIRKMQISQIKKADYNPRVELRPGDPVYEKLKSSIETFGFCEPLIFNRRTDNLIGGHQRLTVLKDLGYTEAEVVVVELPLEQEKAFNIALNKIQGDWDERKLALLLDELTKVPEFNVELTGFETEEISDLLDRSLTVDSPQAKEENFDVEEALDRENPAVTQPGELIELGNHHLLCGDSGKLSALKKLIRNNKVHLFFTDPPYNCNYYSGNRPQPEKAQPKQSRQWKPIYSDNVNQDEYIKWLGTVLRNVGKFLAAGAPVYIWNGHRQFGPMHQLLGTIGIKVSCVITWAKESFAIGYGDYNQQTEFCLYGWLENNGAHRWYGPTNESTLWQIHRDPTKEYKHPTQKPLALAERAISNSSRRGQVVLDTFLGSGTTLIAAERLSRKCFGIEIDPHYCDVIIRRWIAFVGVDNAPQNLVEKYCVGKFKEVKI